MKNTERKKTYAQEKLLKIIQNRELGKWCQDRNLEHSTIYRIATGENIPTYRVICSMIDTIPPAEWIYYTDEKIPYEVKTLPRWNPDNPSGFIKKHRYDWKEIAMQYDLSVNTAYNVFVSKITYPSIKIIRKFINDINPDLFFKDDTEIQIKLPPQRGDVINIGGINYFIISKPEYYKKNHESIGCIISPNDENGMPLKKEILEGFVTLELKSLSFEDENALYIGHLKDSNINSILSTFRKIVEE